MLSIGDYGIYFALETIKIDRNAIFAKLLVHYSPGRGLVVNFRKKCGKMR